MIARRGYYIDEGMVLFTVTVIGGTGNTEIQSGSRNSNGTKSTHTTDCKVEVDATTDHYRHIESSSIV